MIVIFNKGEAPSKNQDATACPHSWYATFLFYFVSSVNDCYKPAKTLSLADSKSYGSTNLWFFLTAKIAA